MWVFLRVISLLHRSPLHVEVEAYVSFNTSLVRRSCCQIRSFRFEPGFYGSITL